MKLLLTSLCLLFSLQGWSQTFQFGPSTSNPYMWGATMSQVEDWTSSQHWKLLDAQHIVGEGSQWVLTYAVPGNLNVHYTFQGNTVYSMGWTVLGKDNESTHNLLTTTFQRKKEGLWIDSKHKAFITCQTLSTGDSRKLYSYLVVRGTVR